jgi:hypothetical protein
MIACFFIYKFFLSFKNNFEKKLVERLMLFEISVYDINKEACTEVDNHVYVDIAPYHSGLYLYASINVE